MSAEVDVRELLVRLAALIGAEWVQRGWNLISLTRTVTADSATTYSVDVVGPMWIDHTQAHFMGRSAWMVPLIGTGVIGTIYADTPDHLVDHVAGVVGRLGIGPT